MFNFIFRRTKEEAHASEKELFSLADGELPRGETTRLRAHLEHCWKCRVLAEKHEQTIAEVVDYVHRGFAQRIPPPPNSWRGFESKLQRAQAAPRLSAQPYGLKHLRLSIPNRWLAGTAGMAAALAVVVMLIRLFPAAPVVSAAALLQRSASSDQMLLANGRQVVRRSFTLEERRSSTGEVLSVRRVETWQGPGRRMARRVYSKESKLVAAEWFGPGGTRTLYDHSNLRVAAPNGQNTLDRDFVWQLSPCAEDFTRVTQDVDKVTVEVLPTAYVLRYQGGATRGTPRLLNASLTLRRADLHAIEQTMRVEQDAEARDYRLVETSFEARPAAEVAASVFEVDTSLTTLAHSEAIPAVAFPLTAALQIAVLARLDQTEALLQQQVAVKRGRSGAILVEGVVDSPERKAEVIGSLGDLARNPAVKVSLLTAAEADRRQLQGPPPQLQSQSTEALETHIAAAVELREYLRRIRHLSGEQLEREETGFADEILAHATRAQLNTQVLRQITGALSDADLSSLPPSAREQWERMIQSHAATVQSELAEVRERLTDVLGDRSVPPVPAPDLDVNALVARLSDLVGIADRGVWQSFSSSIGATDVPAVAGTPFWQALSEAEFVASSIVEKTR